MRVIGLELSDAGIMAAAAGADGPVKVDGCDLESPGFALAEKDRLHIGGTAARKAHLHPRFVSHTYWDRLDTKPVKTPGFDGKTHAELAYLHLERVWDSVKQHGETVLMAVAEYWTPGQLGLILAMAKELSVPVRGFVPISLAAASPSRSGKTLISVDMHLHRTVVTALCQEDPDDRLFVRQTETIPDTGLYEMHSSFADLVAGAFVRQTRYDPLHRAATEQHLYDRLPGLLHDLQQVRTVPFQMREGSHVHGITVSRTAFLEKIRPVFDGVFRLIETLTEDGKRCRGAACAGAVQVTHRANRIFGFKDLWAERAGMEVVSLAPGAGAAGVLALAGRFGKRSGVPLFSSRPGLAGSRPPFGPVSETPPGATHSE